MNSDAESETICVHPRSSVVPLQPVTKCYAHLINVCARRGLGCGTRCRCAARGGAVGFIAMSVAEDVAAEPPRFLSLFWNSAQKANLCTMTLLAWLAACDGSVAAVEEAFLRRIHKAGA